MSTIIVATDFSEVAGNAVRYACDMATEHHAAVTVLHSFMIPVSFGETPLPMMPVDEAVGAAEEQMKELISSFKISYPQLEIGSKIMYGDISDCLEEYSEEQKPWLVIIGNSGSGDADSWLGSSVSGILRHRKSTVIAVAPETSYKKPEKICFAYDFRNIEHEFQAGNLIGLVSAMGAQLHVLNIATGKKGEEPASVETTALYSSLSALNPVYHHVESEKIDESIIEFVEMNHMDWLVIFPHKHSFLEGLFHKSHTKKVARHIHIPLVSVTGKQ